MISVGHEILTTILLAAAATASKGPFSANVKIMTGHNIQSIMTVQPLPRFSIPFQKVGKNLQYNISFLKISSHFLLLMGFCKNFLVSEKKNYF